MSEEDEEEDDDDESVNSLEPSLAPSAWSKSRCLLLGLFLLLVVLFQIPLLQDEEKEEGAVILDAGMVTTPPIISAAEKGEARSEPGKKETSDNVDLQNSDDVKDQEENGVVVKEKEEPGADGKRGEGGSIDLSSVGKTEKEIERENRKKEQETRKKEREAREREQEARKKEQEVRKREQEARKKEQEAREREQEAREKEQEALEEEIRKRTPSPTYYPSHWPTRSPTVDIDPAELRKFTLGVRVHKNYFDGGKQFVYEADEMEDVSKNFDDWWFENVPPSELDKYFLKDEILSSLLKPDGKSQSTKCRSYRNFCCLSSTFIFMPKDIWAPPNTTMLWTRYRPPKGRRPSSLADSLDLIIDRFEKTRLKRSRKYAHLLLMGDSITIQSYLAFLCSIQRTLGTRVVEYHHNDMTLKDYKITGGLDPVEYLPRSIDESIIEVNSTKHGVRRIKITLLQVFQDVVGSSNQMDSFLIKTACGIPFTTVDTKGQNVTVKGNADVDVILFNFGIHVGYPQYPAMINSSINFAIECQKRGIQMIFRETSAMHINTISEGGKTPSIGHCPLILFNGLDDINARYQQMKTVVKEKINILDPNSDFLCKRKDYLDKIDYIPMFAASTLFRRNHFTDSGKDCVHYGYTPAFFQPVIDGLYQSIYSWTLKTGECVNASLPSGFVQANEGLKKGVAEHHQLEFLPNMITPRSMPLNLTNDFILAPLMNFTRH